MDWTSMIERLRSRHDLGGDESHGLMREMLTGEVAPDLVAALLVALKDKGESAEEISGMLRAVREASTKVVLGPSTLDRAIDIVGTGGDNSHSVNVSTMASFVVAGAGVPVCKHGNRAASSKCGTADVLEELGAHIESSPDAVRRCVEQANFGFCFAPAFHPSFRHVGPIRRQLGVPTVFNVLGPLANPASVRFLLVGVGNPSFVRRMAEALSDSGVSRAWVAHGHGGLDEMSLSGPNEVFEVGRGSVQPKIIDGSDHGLTRVDIDRLRGGDPRFNADVVRRTLGGEKGPIRDVVVFNAAAALTVCGATSTIDEGLAQARQSIDSGEAEACLRRYVETSNS